MPDPEERKKLSHWFEDVFTAAAFAEAGEPDDARRIIGEQDGRRAKRNGALRHGLRLGKEDRGLLRGEM